MSQKLFCDLVVGDNFYYIVGDRLPNNAPNLNEMVCSKIVSIDVDLVNTCEDTKTNYYTIKLEDGAAFCFTECEYRDFNTMLDDWDEFMSTYAEGIRDMWNSRIERNIEFHLIEIQNHQQEIENLNAQII